MTRSSDEAQQRSPSPTAASTTAATCGIIKDSHTDGQDQQKSSHHKMTDEVKHARFDEKKCRSGGNS
uniref:Uncharacterized protein n=1 Tax=Syphacia muris TaxID=451379 RepID=A0A0N5AA93_9BILA